MKADKFKPELHFEEIKDWSKDRGLGMVPKELLPKTGRIVPGVCAAFLYLTDSKVAFLENMISNPQTDKALASEALDLCVKAIEQDAKESGVSLIWSSTCIPQVMKRAESLGFQVQTRVYKLILKGI